MMKLTKITGLLAIAVGVAACSAPNDASQNLIVDAPQAVLPHADSDTANTQLGYFIAPEDVQTRRVAASSVEAVPSQYDVVDVIVDVPDYLVVSEADVYLPQADIVWREDPLGDRRAQVKTIMENALTAGTTPLNGPQKVIISVQMQMFHALTEKTRNSIGGRHNVQFAYVLLDAETRRPISSVKKVDASLKAYGGSRAYRAMRKGETQKVRISRHVGDIVRGQLTTAKSS